MLLRLLHQHFANYFRKPSASICGRNAGLRSVSK